MIDANPCIPVGTHATWFGDSLDSPELFRSAPNVDAFATHLDAAGELGRASIDRQAETRRGTVSPAADGFSAVDDAADPSSLVGYLDRMSGHLGEVKRRIQEQLEVHEGQVVLDVGCGTGDDVRDLSALVGPTGRVIGVDASTTMVKEAWRRVSGWPVLVEFCVGDAQALPFAAARFDVCRAERVLQHLPHPALAVSEMARVTRAGGRVVAFEPDWQTLVVDHPDHALTRRILEFRAGKLASPWIGRQLARLFRCAGLAVISVLVVPIALGLHEIIDVLRLDTALQQAIQAGVIKPSDKSRWLAELAELAKTGPFVAVVTGFLVKGVKVGGRVPSRGPSAQHTESNDRTADIDITDMRFESISVSAG
jgi:ubiquinone/menaquinone biosynthesis C-methylase UbiE